MYTVTAYCPDGMGPTITSTSPEVALLTAASTAPTMTTGFGGRLLPKILRSPPPAGRELGATESILNEPVPPAVVVVGAAVVELTEATVVVGGPVVEVTVDVGVTVVVVTLPVVPVAPVVDVGLGVVEVGVGVDVGGTVVVLPGVVVEADGRVVGPVAVVVVVAPPIPGPVPAPTVVDGNAPDVVVNGLVVLVTGFVVVVTDEDVGGAVVAPATVVLVGAPVVVVAATDVVVEAVVVVDAAGVGEGWPTLKNTAWGLPMGAPGEDAWAAYATRAYVPPAKPGLGRLSSIGLAP